MQKKPIIRINEHHHLVIETQILPLPNEIQASIVNRLGEKHSDLSIELLDAKKGHFRLKSEAWLKRGDYFVNLVYRNAQGQISTQNQPIVVAASSTQPTFKPSPMPPASTENTQDWDYVKQQPAILKQIDW